MARFESSIRRARSALVVLAASACLQLAATPAQSQEGLCGVVPAGGIDATTDDVCMRPLVICNIQGCPEFGGICPKVPGLPDKMELSYLAEMSQEWGPFPRGSGPFCSKTVENWVKVCVSVVNSSVTCLAHQIDGLARQDKQGCKAFAGSESKACAAAVDEAAEGYLTTLTDSQGMAQTRCARSVGNHFFRTCMFNVAPLP